MLSRQSPILLHQALSFKVTVRKSEIKASFERTQQEFVEHMKALKPPSSAAEGPLTSRNGFFKGSPRTTMIKRRTIMHKTGLSESPLKLRDFDQAPHYKVLYRGMHALHDSREL